MTRHVVVMGVSGSGKTTIGRALAEDLGVPFAEGDEFHSDASRAKMAAGIGLDDSDREPWLATLRDWMTAQNHQGGLVEARIETRGGLDDGVFAGGDTADVRSVVACSALKRSYRDVLREAEGDVLFILPQVSAETIESRMASRSDHYMPTSLLASQLETLETLEEDEAGFVVDAALSPDDIVTVALQRLAL